MKNFNLKSVLYVLVFSFFALLSCSKSDEPAVDPLGYSTAYTATDITGSSFKASWTRVYGAEKYLLDVSTSATFSTFLPNYKDLAVTNLTSIVSGLNEFTTYYYRVRAVRGSEFSEYSNIISTKTMGVGPEPVVALKDKATSFLVGVAVNSFNLTGSYDTTIKKEFNSITAENEMKMQNIFKGPNSYNFVEVDKLLDYAAANKLNVHGHALVWHGSIPTWLQNYTGTDAEFSKLIEDYITAVVVHCKGKVRSWDVVNEAVNDGGGMRSTLFKQRLGVDYVQKCFQWARAAAVASGDTNLLLFYNDYNTATDLSKQNDVYNLVNKMITAKTIDGIGMQMHINYNGPSKMQLQVDVDRALAKKLILHFSEVDIRANSSDPALTTFTPERDLAQKEKYREIVQIYNTVPVVYKYAITMWGLKDNDSWIISLYGRPDWPLLFDSTFKPKSAHTGFLEGLN